MSDASYCIDAAEDAASRGPDDASGGENIDASDDAIADPAGDGGLTPICGPTEQPLTLNLDAFETASVGAAIDDAQVLSLADCPHVHNIVWLEFGRATWLMHPTDGGLCELWLGGETEDPRYDGSPTQYCLFQRSGSVTVLFGHGGQGGGPATVDSDCCVP